MSASVMADSLAPKARHANGDDAFYDEFDRMDDASVVSNITFNSLDTNVTKPGTKLKRTKSRKDKKKRKSRKGLFGKDKKASKIKESEDKDGPIEKTPLYKRMVSNRACKPQTLAQVKSSELSIFSDSPSIFSEESVAVADDEGSVALRLNNMKLVDMRPQVKLTEEQQSNLKKKSLTYKAMGETSFEVGNYEEAYESYHELYLCLLSLYGKDDENVASVILMLAKVDQMRNIDPKLVDALYEEAYRIQIKHHGIYSKEAHEVLESRATFIEKTTLQHGADVLKLFAECQIRRDFKARSKSDNPKSIDSKKVTLLYLKSGELYLNTLNYDLAFLMFKRAFKWLRKGDRNGSYEKMESYGTVIFMMGVTNEKLGDTLIKNRDELFIIEAKSKYAAAIDYFDEASKVYKIQKGTKSKEKEALNRSKTCANKRHQKFTNEIVIEADLSEFIRDIGIDKEAGKKEKKRMLKRLSGPFKSKTKKELKKENFESMINTQLSESFEPCMMRGKNAVSTKDYSTALNEFQKAFTISNKVNGKGTTELAHVLEKIAETYTLLAVESKSNSTKSLAYHDEAVVSYSEALRIHRSNNIDVHSMRVLQTLKQMLLKHNIDDKTYEMMGNNCVKNRKYTQALDCYRRAYYALKKTMGDMHIDVAFLLTKMANLEAVITAPRGQTKHDIDKVSSCFNQALQIILNSKDEDYIITLKTMHKASVGEIMFLRAMDIAALQFYDEIQLKNVDKIVAKGCTRLLCVWSNLGEIHFSRSNFDDAAKYFGKAIDTRESRDEEYGILVHCLALVFEKMGDQNLANSDSEKSFMAYDQAIIKFKEAGDVFQSILGEGHENVLSTLHHTAYLHMKKRDIDAAVPCYLKELNEIRARKPRDKRIPDIYKLLSIAALKKKQYDAALKYLSKATDFCRSNDGMDNVLKITLVKQIQIYGKIKDYEQAIVTYKELLHLSSNLLRFEEYSALRYKLGKLCVLAGKATEAIDLYEEALPILTCDIEENYDDIFKTLYYLGNIYFNKGKYVYDKALGCYEGALKIASVFTDVNKACLQSAMNNTGFIYFCVGDLCKAAATYTAAIDLCKNTNNDSNYRAFATLNGNLANVLVRLGNYDIARIHHDEASRIKKYLYGDNAEVVGFSEKIGSLYMDMNDTDTAQECYEEALEAREAELGKDAHEVVEIHKQLAHIYSIKEEWNKAKSTYQNILSIQSRQHGKENKEAMQTMFQLGYVLFKLRQNEVALEWYESGLRICESDEKKGTVLNSMGNVYMKQGKYEEALASYRKSLVLKKIVHGENNKAVSRTLYNIGVVCQKLNNFDEAARSMRHAIEVNKKSNNGDLHPSKVAKTMIDLAKVYYSNRQYPEAKKLFVDAEWCLREVKTPETDKSMQSIKVCLERVEVRLEKNRLREVARDVNKVSA